MRAGLNSEAVHLAADSEAIHLAADGEALHLGADIQAGTHSLIKYPIRRAGQDSSGDQLGRAIV